MHHPYLVRIHVFYFLVSIVFFDVNLIIDVNLSYSYIDLRKVFFQAYT